MKVTIDEYCFDLKTLFDPVNLRISLKKKKSCQHCSYHAADTAQCPAAEESTM